MAATGYVDLQVNGFRGVDFSSPELTVENFRRAAEGMLQTGTELFLPTLVTSPMERYRRNCDIIRTAVEREGWQRQIPGVHLEGPFLTPEPGAIGCHNPEWVIPPDPTLLDALGDIVRMITVAAERPGMPEFIHEAAGRGILVSLGHQLATTNELRRAAAAGARTLTHLGNGIPNGKVNKVRKFGGKDTESGTGDDVGHLLSYALVSLSLGHVTPDAEHGAHGVLDGAAHEVAAQECRHLGIFVLEFIVKRAWSLQDPDIRIGIQRDF